MIATLLLLAPFTQVAQDPPVPKLALTFDQACGRDESVSFSGNFEPAEWAPDGIHLSVRDGDKLWWEDPVTGKRVEPDGDIAPAERPRRRRRAEGNPLEAASPDGRRTAVVRNHNLVVRPKEGEDAWTVTADGSPDLLYGRLDWVYQEEVYGRGNFNAVWWSPASTHLAFLRLDESKVKTFTIVDHLPDGLDVNRGVATERQRYPKAGDPNPSASLGIADCEKRSVVYADLAKYEPDILIVRVGFSPDGRHVVFQVQNRIQTWLDLNVADPATGAVTTLFRETSSAWVDVIDGLEWLADGTFLWQSDRSGHRHLYRYSVDGKLLNPVTEGAFDVREVLKVDAKAGRVWFMSNKDGAVRPNLYRVSADGSDLVRLTHGAGDHSVSFNREGSLYLSIASTVSSPPVQQLCDTGDGAVRKTVARSVIPHLETHVFATPEIVEIPARDGFAMDALVVRPPPGPPEVRHAVWVETYSGPNSPTVYDDWHPSRWTQFLVQKGVLVLQVNVRSASGKGKAATSTCYRRLGVQELRDLEDAVAWVCANRNGDPARVGITGWSYGGFMAAYALTHSRAFRLGIACAGVYDWRLYDTIYTERFMDLPSGNKEGYAETSCVAAAKDLNGHLVLIHGTLDDNVHMQNAMRFAYELQKAEKDFELMLYPKWRHGPQGPAAGEQTRHMRGVIWRAIQTHLGVR